MRNKNVSIRGALVRDMIHDIMETSLGKPIQTGEFRKNPVEPAWVCPSGYEYEIIDREPFKMEYLKPEGVVTGRVVLQLHGGGYIGPMKNIYRKFSVRYSRLSYGGDVLTVDYSVAPEHPYPTSGWLRKNTTGRARWWLPVIPQEAAWPWPCVFTSGTMGCLSPPGWCSCPPGPI